jgi:hypothetical protein
VCVCVCVCARVCVPVCVCARVCARPQGTETFKDVMANTSMQNWYCATSMLHALSFAPLGRIDRVGLLTVYHSHLPGIFSVQVCGHDGGGGLARDGGVGRRVFFLKRCSGYTPAVRLILGLPPLVVPGTGRWQGSRWTSAP